MLGNLFENAPGPYDLIASNPPYIPTKEAKELLNDGRNEPILALDGGPDGCDIYRRIIRDAGSVLVPGGRLLMEMGINESHLLSALLSTHGFSSVEIRQDYSGIDRMILAILP